MKFIPSFLGFIGGWLLIAMVVCSGAQVRPELDPNLPVYSLSDTVDGKLTVSGSSTMFPIIKSWAEEIQKRHPRVKIRIEGGGSETGLSALLEHRVQMAAMSRRMTASEIAEFIKEYGYEPSEVSVAIDALAIFVHKDNPVTGLSLDDLDSMFCVQRRRGLSYQVDSWGLVGLMDEWFEKPVHLYGRNGQSGTSQFFREEVCKDGTFRPQMIHEPGSASVVLDVAKDIEGIGFSAIGYRTSAVKPVPIASVKGGRFVEPSFQAALDGTYPLRRYLYLYIDKGPKTTSPPIITELVRFALSAQGQQIVLDQGYFPLPISEITRLLNKWAPSSLSAAQSSSSIRLSN